MKPPATRIVAAAAIALAALVLGVLGVRASRDETRTDRSAPEGAPQGPQRPVSDIHRRTRFMMTTYVTIQAIGPEKETVEAINGALDAMERVDRKFSARKEGSQVHAFNHSGTPIRDPEILAVVRGAMEIGEKTGGAFDITVFRLLELWRFGSDAPRVPEPAEVEKALELVGHDGLVLAEGALRPAREGVQIDLGGIAKGYALAEAVRVLKEKGVESAVVDAGGDVYALGTRDGKPWNVGLQDPRGEGLMGHVEAVDTAVMGSGDYERGFTEGGRRYHHILDPKTGYPAKGLASVTVICPDPVLADGWSTALMAMGPEKGLEAARSQTGLQAIFVTEDGRVLTTDSAASTDE